MRKTALQFCSAFGLSLSVFYIFLIRFTSFLMYTKQEKLQISGLLFFIGVPLLAYCFFLFIKKVSELHYPFATILKVGFFSILLSTLFLFFFYKTPPFPMVFDLIIKPVVVSAGQPFEKEIHILSVSAIEKPSNQERLLTNPLKVSENWDFNSNNGASTYLGTGSGTLEYHEYIQGNLKISFEKSPQAGTVTVTLNNQEQIIDLYAPEIGVVEVNLAVPYTFREADSLRKAVLIGLLLAEFLFFSFLFLCLAMVFDQVFRKKTIRMRGCGTVLLVIAVSLSMMFLINHLEKEVLFVDEKMEAAIREVIGNQNKPIYYQQLQTIAYLDLTGKGIHSLEGIENLKNLIELRADYNFISDLTPLGSLKNLRSLSLEGNSITDLKASNIEAIASLPIRSLNLSDNVNLSSKFFRIKLSDITIIKRILITRRIEPAK